MIPKNLVKWRSLVILALLVYRGAISQEDSFSYKYQNYKEENGRIQILAHYAYWDVAISDTLRMSLTGLSDAISGASPTGVKDDSEDGLRYGTLPKEIRKSTVVDLSWAQSERREWVAQFSYSREPDYISKGLALSGLYFKNNKNTTFRYGISHMIDEVKSSPSDTDKSATDFVLGITQVIDQSTLFTANLTIGYGEGYLADPYKGVGRTESAPFPGFPDRVVSYFESRPDNRLKGIFYVSAQRYFEKANGAIDGNYRFYVDDWNVQSHTLGLTWRQKIGENFVIEPHCRYYVQTEADFYLLTLDGTGIDPNTAFESAIPNGTGPYYSSDYRLSHFEAFTYGLKFNWFVGERFKIDLGYEIYDMSGLDNTPETAYPKAKTYTLGIRYVF